MSEGISRRRFMAGVVAAAAATAAGCSNDGSDGADRPTSLGSTTPSTSKVAVTTTATTGPVPDLPPGLFRLGVASGEPLADSVILWTRLAPEPMAGGGMPAADVPVRWELATDPTFATVAASGVATASATFAHSVHVDVDGLQPATSYHYRFVAGTETSPVGTTRTAPAADADVDSLRFLFASCQNWTGGYWTAWPHAAAEEPDLIVFLGDYIYEGGPGGDTAVRHHASEEVTTLAGYRNRYGQYQGDPGLQAAHAAAPWVITWDDHEVENDYAGERQQDPDDGVDFVARRAAAYQAFYEHHAVRIDPPDGDHVVLYRTLDWGRLARFHVLDGRQFRSEQPCGEAGADFAADCAARAAPTQTMLGAEQEAWLGEQFASSEAAWNVIANQTIFSPLPIGGSLFNMDQWDGYPAARTRLIGQLQDSALANPVIITGDIHASGVADVTDAGPSDPVVATEFVGTSISSTFPAALLGAAASIIGGLPHVKWFDGAHRGYVACDLTREELTVRYRVVSTVAAETGDISTSTTWTVRAGTPGATQA